MKIRSIPRSRLFCFLLVLLAFTLCVCGILLQITSSSELVLGLCILFYISWLLLSPDIFVNISRPTLFIFVIVNAIRYVLLPVLILLCSLSTPYPGITVSGCCLFFYEEIISCLFMNILVWRIYKSPLDKESEVPELSKENSYIIYIGFVLLAILAVILFPSLLLSYNFVFSSNTAAYTDLRVGSVVQGAWGIVYKIGFLLFPCIISFVFYKLYLRTKSKCVAVLFVTVLFFFTLGFTEGTSRNSAMIPAVAALLFLLKCFPKKRKSIFIFVSVAIVLAFSLMTISKFSFITSRSGRSYFSGLASSVETTEAYFAGPTNMSVAVEMKGLYESRFGLRTWLGDIFGSWPILSHSFDPYQRTTAYFNETFYGGAFAYDQIIPSVGQGIMHFGYVFSVIPTCVFLLLSSLFDRKMYNTSEYVKSYIFAYISVRFAMILIANTSIISAFIGTPLIELLFLVWLSEKIKPVAIKQHS